MRRIRSRLSTLLPLGAAALLATVATDARAQSGVVNKPIPNVMLLIDTSGSMERMPDNSLPSANRNPVDGTTIVPGPSTPGNACTPGIETNPNRWGMLLQALTGSMQPYYSCGLMPRTRNAALYNEFKINNQAPYDTDYVLPYHRPLTGGTAANACAFGPNRLPGGGGVGPSNLGSGGQAGDFPADAFQSVRFQHLMAQYGSNSGLSMPLNQCTFDQAPDGQLDISRDYVRFALMTFDSDTDPGLGVTTTLTPPAGGNVGANPFLGQWSYVAANPPILASGRPAGCATFSPLEVGARHWAAPPWEGRMVMFPEPTGSIYDIQRTNEQVQKVLGGTRPWGATPIDGLIGDAQDYLWRHPYGPNQTQPGFEDPYVKGGCRDQYVILLTDGAPNLNLRPQCEAAGVPAGQCPYPRSRDMVYDMVRGIGGPRVTTYVIGFSVNGSGQFTGDGFPTGSPYESAPLNNCKDWYYGAGPQGGAGTPQGMDAACSLARGAGRAQAGSTADACCQLNEIAYFGSGGPASPATATGAFFAETQADLVLAFGRILGNVAKTVATRTVPGYSPAITAGGAPVSGRFNAAFIPNAQRVWSGEIARTRSVCAGPTPTDAPVAQSEGDSFATNVAAQAGAGSRFFISVLGDTNGTGIDSAGTIRPYTGATAGYDDFIPNYSGTEVGGLNMALTGTPNWAQAMGIDDNTCKRSKAPAALGTSGAVTVPRLLTNDCRDVVWGFAVSNASAMFQGTPYNFNVRCTNSAGGLASGRCSISNNSCTIGGPPCTVAGETCVPECSALGAIFRASPTLVGPPNAFLREEAYRGFIDGRALRRPAMFVATTDGVLHAFKALENSATGGGAPNANWEMWNFIPPAVLPRLASNYPSGTQVLLDGTPVVKDMVWDRSAITDRSQWHTTLTAGLGQGGGGYYGLNVSDVDCGGVSPTIGNGCNPGGWTAASTTLSTAAAGGGLDAGARRGPHFLWQLTDVRKTAGENAKTLRRGPDGLERVALFGSQTGTPALATLQMNPDGIGTRQIGVAILPGGIDGPPVKNQMCNRAINGGAMGAYAAGTFDRSDPANPPRTQVRRWGATCNVDPVPGRGVTIVRADTGEIIRHFGRRAQDVPQAIWPRTTDTAFDAPMIGTPVVYPNSVGAITQRVYVGDADGTLWMIDVSRPDPATWQAYLMQDLIRTNGFADSQPITLAPVLTLDPTGTLNINVATGDLENIVSSTVPNYVYSIREEAPSTVNAFLPRSNVRWFRTLANGERVTGPMVVFDRTLYYATHVPESLGSICSGTARSRLWGVDFILQATPGSAAGGPVPRWCPIGTTDPATGVCNAGAYTLFEDIPAAANVILPGVSLRANLPCATFGAVPDDPSGGITGLTPGPTHFLEVPIPSGAGVPGGSLVPPTLSLARAPASTPSSIDAWAIVTD